MENKKRQFEDMLNKIKQREAQREKSYNKFVKTDIKVPALSCISVNTKQIYPAVIFLTLSNHEPYRGKMRS
jgi:cytidylate kinase